MLMLEATGRSDKRRLSYQERTVRSFIIRRSRQTFLRKGGVPQSGSKITYPVLTSSKKTKGVSVTVIALLINVMRVERERGVVRPDMLIVNLAASSIKTGRFHRPDAARYAGL